MQKTERFGEYLVRQKVLSRENLSALLASQRLVREPLGALAVRDGMLDEAQLTTHLSKHLGIPLLEETVSKIDKEVVNTVPRKMALKAEVLPVGTGPYGELLLACSGPVPKTLMQNISRLAKRQVKLVLTGASKVRQMQQRSYSQAYDTSIKLDQRGDTGNIGMAIELVEKLMLRSLNMGASDLHIEPGRNELLVRMRVDGLLVRSESLPPDLSGKIISRIKVLANLDIAERRKPQDGAFYFKPQSLDVAIAGVNVRVSTLPVVDGEKAVLRLLPPHDETIALDSLGMPARMLERFITHLKNPHGIVLVTGPTGSGKSTTLYGALQVLRSETTNITTIEEPVELTIRGVNQTQVDPGEKISFAAALRAILRQDPDIVMVGEIRDADTLTVALRAAITGHLVLSTLHTNDAPSAFSRLLDMGAEPFLVAASVRAVLAQRLVRKVCPDCAEAYELQPAEKAMLGIQADQCVQARRGAGCEACRGTGYQGRIGLFEFFEVDDPLQQMIMQGANFEDMRQYGVDRKGFRTLSRDGVEKIAKGITTPEEIMRVTMG